MTDFVIYHNPRCSKSRAALELLLSHGIKPRIIDYLKTSFDKKSLKTLIQQLQLKPREILRSNEDEYSKLQLDDLKKTDNEIIDAIVQHPILLQRPIVVHNNRAVIGRPSERVKEILRCQSFFLQTGNARK